MPELTQRRRLLVLAICCLSLLVVGMDVTIVNVALPAIRSDLHASVSGLQWVIDAYFPPEGHLTQPVEAGYMANAYVRMRHPDYDTLREMLDDVGRTVHLHAVAG